MANQNFTDFTLKTPPANNDFLVGYNADGSAEFRTTLRSLASASFTNAFQHYYTVYVDKLGNDSTARLGNPFYPFRTPQTAYASLSYLAGLGFPCVIKFSPGNFEGITIAANWPFNLSIQGAGPSTTIIAGISSPNVDMLGQLVSGTFGISLRGDFSYTLLNLEVGSVTDSEVSSNAVPAGDLYINNLICNRVKHGDSWGPNSTLSRLTIDTCQIGVGGLTTGFAEEAGQPWMIRNTTIDGNVDFSGTGNGGGLIKIDSCQFYGSTSSGFNSQTLNIKNSILNDLTVSNAINNPNSPVYIYNSVLGDVSLGANSEDPSNTNYFWHSMFKSLTNVSGLSAGNYNSVDALIN